MSLQKRINKIENTFHTIEAFSFALALLVFLSLVFYAGVKAGEDNILAPLKYHSAGCYEAFMRNFK